MFYAKYYDDYIFSEIERRIKANDPVYNEQFEYAVNITFKKNYFKDKLYNYM
jgi:hypothetical protein